MWFKNLVIFRLTENFALSASELEEKLTQVAFRPCGQHEASTFGWVSPLGRSSQQLAHTANGFIMLCVQKEEKILPASVINEHCLERFTEIENQQGRKPSKKERDAIKDEVMFDLLPRAFSHSRKTYAYIDPKGGWIIADAASAKKAEDLLSLLRKCLGSLPAIPLNTIEKPADVMSQWLLNGQAPQEITVEDECELRSPEENGGIIRCKRHDLSLPEIKNHLESGKQVIKLAVSWSDRLSFVIDETLAIKRLRFLDLIQDQLSEVETADEADQFDTEFSIMSLELANFLPRYLELFGGLLQS